MAVGRYSGYTASFDNGTPTEDFDLTQLNNVAFNPNITVSQFMPMGLVDIDAAITAFADPQFRLRTADLQKVLANVGWGTGYCTEAGADFRYQQRNACSTFDVNAVHSLLRAEKGFLYIDSIQADQDSADGAQAELIFVPLYNGSAEIIEHTTNVNLSGVTAPAFNSAFYLGPMYHKGLEVPGITSVRLDTGITFDTRRTSGAHYPVTGVITARRPQITITTLKLDEGLTALETTLFGDNVGTEFTFYLRKGLDGGTRYGDGTTNHVMVQATTGHLRYDDVTVNQNDDATLSITCTPTALGVAYDQTIPHA
jgi:hypothetical protein